LLLSSFAALVYYISQSHKDKDDCKKNLIILPNLIIAETSYFESISDFGRLKHEIIKKNEVFQ